MNVAVYVCDEFVENASHPRKDAATTPWRTLYSFAPIPDLDEWSDEGRVHRTRRHGEEPTYWLGTLGGSFFEGNGKKYLKTARTPAIDVSDALVMARQNSPDVWFIGRPGVTPPPMEATPTPVPETPAPKGPVKQGGFQWD